MLCFRYNGPVGHFLRAEMNASALSYPVPPRTSLLGLLAAILGLPKDAATVELDGWKDGTTPESWQDRQTLIGLAGAVPGRHYHRANIRKRSGLADPLPLHIRPAKPGEQTPDVTGGGAASQVTQEWLISPDFRVFVAIRNRKWMDELCDRMSRPAARTHFTPSLGLAWMVACVQPEVIADAQPLAPGRHQVITVCRKHTVRLPTLDALAGLAVQEVRMPRSVTPERVFAQDNYYVEMNGRVLPVDTGEAWSFAGEAIAIL